MYRDWPDELTGFESFLEQMGLVFKWTWQAPGAPYREVQWADDRLRVKAVWEKGLWWIEIADAAWPDKPYGVRTIRDFLHAQITASPMTIQESVSFLESNWAAVVSSFAPECASMTHAALQLAAGENARRLFPQERWYSPFVRSLRRFRHRHT
jgi:hypothetical protein